MEEPTKVLGLKKDSETAQHSQTAKRPVDMATGGREPDLASGQVVLLLLLQTRAGVELEEDDVAILHDVGLHGWEGKRQ